MTSWRLSPSLDLDPKWSHWDAREAFNQDTLNAAFNALVSQGEIKGET